MAAKGTLGSFTFNNQIYRVANDVDVDRKNKYNVEPLASSGDPDFMYENQVETAEGFVILVSGSERHKFKVAANVIGGYDCSYTNKAGDNYTAECVINITADNTREGKITFDAMPTSAAGWTPTLV